MKRGHRRPLGSERRIRLFDAPAEPELGTLIYDDPQELERAYRIVGVEEVARPGRWNLVAERISWDELMTCGDRIAFGLVPVGR